MRPIINRISNRRLFLLAPCAFLACGAAFGVARHPSDDRIAPGVNVGALPLGGKTIEEARAALEAWNKERQSAPLLLRPPPESPIRATFKTKAETLGLGIDVPATLADAQKAGDQGVVGQVSGWINGPKATQVTPRASVNAEVLRAYLLKIAHTMNRAPKNARLKILPSGGFGINADRPGLKLDPDASSNAIKDAWNGTLSKLPAPPTESPSDSAATPAENPIDATLVLQRVPAALTKADIKQINGLLGSFTTRFGGTGRNRGSNIALAASHINGTLVRPGGIFSYNKVVGPRIGSAGFKDAPVIIHGELVPGVGGGICQVSSTLYNAVLLSDLKVVQRSHHAFPVHYLPAGRDATVVDGAIDFQFQNNTPAPLYIAASADRGRLTFRIFGKRAPERSVSIELANHTTQPCDTETRFDRSVRPGRRVVKDKGHRGHRVTVYRVVKEHGKVVQRELISRDHYRPFPAIVLVGPKRQIASVKPTIRPDKSVTPAPPTPTPTPPDPDNGQ